MSLHSHLPNTSATTQQLTAPDSTISQVLMLYSTVDGHTQRIAETITEQLSARNYQCDIFDLPSLEDHPQPFSLLSYDLVVIGASVRYGRHRQHVTDFIGKHYEQLQQLTCAFFSVNLVARKANKNTAATNPYLNKLLLQLNWQPDLVEVFAGKLDYQKYHFIDRYMIKLIMLCTGGPTHSSACIDYTDWQRVIKFAQQIDLLHHAKNRAGSKRER